ncbi:MAG: ATP-binding protein [Chloroherpetonaceae bacterium]|nr:ATP-binding protein [Chloroherpetonaceae bacterium]
MNLFQKPKLWLQLLLLFIAVEFPAEALLTFVSYRSAESSLQEEITNSLNAIATRQANQISSFLAERKRNTTSLSRIPDIVSFTEQLSNTISNDGIQTPAYQGALDLIRPQMLDYRDNFQFKDLYLISTSGDVLFAANDLKQIGVSFKSTEYKSSEIARVFTRSNTILQTEISDFSFLPGAGEPSAFLASPVFKNGRALGVLIAQFDNDDISRVVNDYTGLGETGESVLVSRISGSREAVFLTNVRNAANAAFKKKILIGSNSDLALEEAVQGKSGSGVVKDYRGEEVLAVWSYIPSLRSGLVIKIDTADAFAPIERLKLILIVIIILTLVVVVFAALSVAKSISKPIVKLTAVTDSIAKGNLSQRAEVKERNEIGQLAASFNLMTENLQKSQLELEEANRTLELKVESRTEELRENNETLKKTLDELQSSQTQLIQSEKMASLGQMVAGLAHEVNTPLGFVRGSVDIIQKNHTLISESLKSHQEMLRLLEAGEMEKLEVLINQVKEIDQKVTRTHALEKIQTRINESLIGLDRIQELIINLKNFSRLDESAFKSVDINEGLDSTILISTPFLKYKVEIIKEYQPRLIAECYPSRLNQVFLNLITNAAQAIEENGVIQIKTYTEDGKAVISISDNGKGIESHNLKKIFEPFYTTKPIGQGTGLGLSIAYKIVEQHNGDIEVDSTVGKGSTFRVRIPLTQRKL